MFNSFHKFFADKNRVGILLFAILIFIGVLVYDDYGMSMDEEFQRTHSIVTYKWLNRKLFDRGVFIGEGTEDLQHYSGRKYGVALQMPLVFAEDVYNVLHGEPMSFRQIYLMRHAYLHAFFLIGLYCFYCMLCDLYKKPLLSAAGVLMIYVFGRIFADSFYNVKDLLFTSVSLIELYFGERLLRSGRSTKWCILYAISTAFLVTSRIVGAIYPVLLIAVMLVEDIKSGKKIKLKPYILICSSFFIWIAITPAAWADPTTYTSTYIKKFSNYTPKGNLLFNGNYYGGRKVPFDYYLRWIGITAPIVFQLFGIMGLFFFLRQAAKKDINDSREKIEIQMLFSALGVFLITILYQMIKHPTVYNAWRHVYYLYPLIIMMAVKGIHEMFYNSRHQWQQTALVIIAAGSIIYNVYLSIHNHPFEFTALNPIGQMVGSKYDRDYWEAGVYHVMEWITDQDEDGGSIGDIDVVRHNLKADFQFLPDEKQQLFSIPSDDTDYIIFRHNSPASDSAVVEGYTPIKVFSAYNIKLYTVFQKN